MGNAKRIIFNALFQSFSFFAKGGSEILISIAIARLAGVELLSEYAIFIALSLLLKTFSAFGLPSLLTREISRVRQSTVEIHRFIHKSIWFSTYTALATTLLAWGIGWFFDFQGNLAVALMLLVITAILDTITRIYASAFRGIERMQWSSGIESLMELAFLAFAVTTLYLNPRIDLLMGAFLLSRLTALICATILYYRYFGWMKSSGFSLIDTEFARLCIPFFANNLVSFVQTRFDTILVMQLAGPLAVGLYEPATSLTKRMNIFSRILSFAVYPFFSSQFIEDIDALYRNTVKVVRFLLVPSSLIMIVLLLEGKNILQLLYGDKFGASATALAILALSIPFRFISGPLATALSASDRQKERTVAATVAAVANVVLNLAFIPLYGIAGVAFAALLTEALWFLALCWYLRTDLKPNISRHLLVTPGLALVSVAIGILIHDMFSSPLLYLLPALSIFAGGVVLTEPSVIEVVRALMPKTKLQGV